MDALWEGTRSLGSISFFFLDADHMSKCLCVQCAIGQRLSRMPSPYFCAKRSITDVSVRGSVDVDLPCCVSVHFGFCPSFYQLRRITLIHSDSVGTKLTESVCCCSKRHENLTVCEMASSGGSRGGALRRSAADISKNMTDVCRPSC